MRSSVTSAVADDLVRSGVASRGAPSPRIEGVLVTAEMPQFLGRRPHQRPLLPHVRSLAIAKVQSWRRIIWEENQPLWALSECGSKPMTRRQICGPTFLMSLKPIMRVIIRS
ncbi:hypothetical protein CRG98_008975 [Punica granatum]|uniref:Uncharacterized protein n=1 Tax=Punica granatum TaxID=22663 RepID=A0A2I0KQK1_PUNGR|nr:hypothetical protein CRG98_008975 [Punica granatum]